MRILIFFSTLFFPILLSAQQDCKENPSDLKPSSVLQTDTTYIIDPKTYEQTIRITQFYHMDELPIVDRKKVGKKTYVYVKKDDCLVIRHVEEMID